MNPTRIPSRSDDSAQPDLSAILVTPDDLQSIRKTLRHLHAQTARHRMEVVIAAPTLDAIDLSEVPADDFSAFRVIEMGAITSTAQARADAIRHAQAPIVALTEDHCFPEPEWAERILKAHRGPWAVVGPRVGNANPEMATSWSNLFIEYGPWMLDAPTDVEHLPGHNSSYKRDLLLAYGDQLGDMMEAESVLHWDLRARGHRLLLDPSIKTNHLNFSRLLDALHMRFCCGRAFATARSQHWSLPRRFLYLLGTPLIPFVRLQRTLRAIWTSSHRHLLSRVLPVMMLLLVADGLGELAAYAFTPSDAGQKLTALEFYRDRHLTNREKHLAFE